MYTVNLKVEGLEEIQNQIRELASKIAEIQQQNKAQKWLSNAEARELLGVTSRTLQNYRDNGIISYSKVGSKIYYKASDIEDHLNAHYFAAFKRERRAE